MSITGTVTASHLPGPRAQRIEVPAGCGFVIRGCCSEDWVWIRRGDELECGCGRRYQAEDCPLPEEPVAGVEIPFEASGNDFGSLSFRRRIVGARTCDGKTEIRCRYGRNERWYPRHA